MHKLPLNSVPRSTYNFRITIYQTSPFVKSDLRGRGILSLCLGFIASQTSLNMNSSNLKLDLFVQQDIQYGRQISKPVSQMQYFKRNETPRHKFVVTVYVNSWRIRTISFNNLEMFLKFDLTYQTEQSKILDQPISMTSRSTWSRDPPDKQIHYISWSTWPINPQDQ